MLKKVLSNTTAQVVAKGVGVALTFLTTVLIIRIGGPGIFGDVTKSLSLIAIGFTAIDFGINAVAVRSMRADARGNKQILLDVVVVRLLLSLLMIMSLNVLIFLLPGGYTPAVKSVFWIGSLAILFQGIYTSINAWFQRGLTYWKMSVSTILGTVAGTLATGASILWSPTLFNLLAASTLGYAVMAAVSMKLSGQFTGISGVQVRQSLSRSLGLIKRSLPLGMILLFAVLASKMDSVILGVFRSSGEVGEYGFAYRIFDVMLVLPVFVMNAVFPLLLDTSHDEKKKLVAKSMGVLLAVSLCAMGAVYSASPLILWIRPDMHIAVSNVRILSLSLPFFYLTAPLMWQLIEAGLEKQLIIVYGLAALMNMGLNYAYVPHFGSLASAVLTGVTEATILAGLYYVRKKHYGRS